MPLTNPWVSYIERSYQQIKDAVLTKMAALVPEITDHTESNLYVKIVSIWAGLVEMMGYYVDNQGREAHVPSARLYSSMAKLAKSHDYRIKASLPASAVVKVTLLSNMVGVDDKTIPAGTEFRTADGLKFFSTEDVAITYGGGIGLSVDYDIPVKQWVQQAEQVIGTSNGQPFQEVEIQEPKFCDGTAVIRVASIVWSQKQTLGFSLGTSKDFVQSVGGSQLAIIQFGDGIQGEIPAGAASITAEFKTTEGAAGNVGANTIVEHEIAAIPNITISVTNPLPATGGAGTETIEQLRYRIPKAIRTLDRAVTYQDYVDIASLAPGVSKAGVRYGCGKYVEVYIVPEGGGIASPSLLSDTQLFIDERKMITTNVTVYAAGEVRIRFVINVNILPSYGKVAVSDQIKANIVAFMSSANQEIGGEVHLSDIYNIIESTPGVSYSEIITMTSSPYARPLGSTTSILSWTRLVLDGSTDTHKWRIQFISNTVYQLFKDDTYVSSHTTGDLVEKTEIAFTVVASGTYANGHEFEFWTYPYFGTIDLLEPSIPVSQLSDVTINATGGI